MHAMEYDPWRVVSCDRMTHLCVCWHSTTTPSAPLHMSSMLGAFADQLGTCRPAPSAPLPSMSTTAPSAPQHHNTICTTTRKSIQKQPPITGSTFPHKKTYEHSARTCFCAAVLFESGPQGWPHRKPSGIHMFVGARKDRALRSESSGSKETCVSQTWSTVARSTLCADLS
jgi:hypothetical protein